MQNINSRAHKLARAILPAYSTYRLAFIAAYRMIRLPATRKFYLNAIAKVETLLYSLKLPKWEVMWETWLAIYNLDYLD